MRAAVNICAALLGAALVMALIEINDLTRERDRQALELANAQARFTGAEDELRVVDAKIAALMAEIARHRAAMNSAKTRRSATP